MRGEQPAILVIAFCGPSGAGKDSCIRLLQDIMPKAIRLVKATTRRKRAEEKHGEDYYFVSLREFQSLRADGVIIGARQSDFDRNWYGIDLRQFNYRGFPPCLGTTCHSFDEYRCDMLALRSIGNFRSIFVQVKCEELIRVTRAKTISRLRQLKKRLASDREIEKKYATSELQPLCFQLDNNNSFAESRMQITQILINAGILTDGDIRTY
jgi:guanylate kinase